MRTEQHEELGDSIHVCVEEGHSACVVPILGHTEGDRCELTGVGTGCGVIEGNCDPYGCANRPLEKDGIGDGSGCGVGWNHPEGYGYS